MIDYSIGVVPAPFAMPRLGEWLHDKLGFWNVLSGAQKVAVISAAFLTIALPLVVRASLQQTRSRSSASVLPGTPPETPPDVTPTVTPTPTPTGRYITVVDPNGRETLIVGQTYRIRWASSTTIDKVWIGYTRGPGSLDWIVTNYPNTGFYDWAVFVGNTTNTQFKIDLTGYQTGVGSAHDQSDAFFTVLKEVQIPTPTPSPTSTPSPTPTPSLTPTPSPTPTSVFLTRRINANNNDGASVTGDPVFHTYGHPDNTPPWSQVNIIAVGGKDKNGTLITSGLRFTNVTIPRGATIVMAKFDFQNNYVPGYGTDVKTKVYGAAIDNLAVFSNTNLPGNIAKTSSSASWNSRAESIPYGQWMSTSVYNKPPTITHIIQEIVNRPGWVSGNALGLIFSDAGSTTDWWWEFLSYESTQGNSEAKLTITYRL